MQIEDNRITNFVEFSKLNCGEVFKLKKHYYMKCRIQSGVNVVDLHYGDIGYIPINTIVEIVNGKIVIEDKWEVSNNVY